MVESSESGGVTDDDDPIGDELWEQWAMITDMYIDLSLILVECYRSVGAAEHFAMPAEAGARNHPFPRMPKRLGRAREHREKNTVPGHRGSDYALVARPVVEPKYWQSQLRPLQ